MPKALARYQPGLEVEMSCYQSGCEDVSIPVTLGGEFPVHPDFVVTYSLGSMHRDEGTAAKGFSLSERFGGSGYCKCPGCNTLFGAVVIISNGSGKPASIFGYSPEPA